jgi:hypothetical protein
MESAIIKCVLYSSLNLMMPANGHPKDRLGGIKTRVVLKDEGILVNTPTHRVVSNNLNLERHIKLVAR